MWWLKPSIETFIGAILVMVSLIMFQNCLWAVFPALLGLFMFVVGLGQLLSPVTTKVFEEED